MAKISVHANTSTTGIYFRNTLYTARGQTSSAKIQGGGGGGGGGAGEPPHTPTLILWWEKPIPKGTNQSREGYNIAIAIWYCVVMCVAMCIN